VPRKIGCLFFDMMLQVIRTARCNTQSARFCAPLYCVLHTEHASAS